MPLYIWGRHPKLPNDAGRWGVVKPTLLKFDEPEEAETIAERYRQTYPEQEFIVSANKPNT